MGTFENLTDRELINIINDNNSDEFDVEQAKEEIHTRYSYMPKYMLKRCRLIYHSYEEEDLIHHGHFLITDAINKYRPNSTCEFKAFLFHVLRKGILNQFFQKDKFRKKEITLTMYCAEQTLTTIDSLNERQTKLSAYDDLMLEEKISNLKENLSESEYNCVIARCLGASYKETAKAFGYTVKKVDYNS